MASIDFWLAWIQWHNAHRPHLGVFAVSTNSWLHQNCCLSHSAMHFVEYCFSSVYYCHCYHSKDFSTCWGILANINHAACQNTLPDHSWIKLYVNTRVHSAGVPLNKLQAVVHLNAHTEFDRGVVGNGVSDIPHGFIAQRSGLPGESCRVLTALGVASPQCQVVAK